VEAYAELPIDRVCLYISGAKGIPVPEDVCEDSGCRRVGPKVRHKSGKEPRRRMPMLTSQEVEVAISKMPDSVDGGSNSFVQKAEELIKVEDSDMKALVKQVLANYEHRRKVNERLRKQVAYLDATVVRLVSIVKGRPDGLCKQGDSRCCG